MAPKQFLQPGSGRTVPLHRAVQLDGRSPDQGQSRSVVIYAVPRDPAIYGAGVHDYYVRCGVQGCGAWSLPFVWMPEGAELRCKVCAERQSAAENFNLFVTDARFGCHVVKEVTLPEPIVRSVVAGI